MRKTMLGLLGTIALLLGLAAPALAFEPVNVVHTEKVQAGPYNLTIGFSTWPLRAMQSLDFTFVPEDGIAGKQGTLAMLWGAELMDDGSPLARHPRKRGVWGLDIQALPAPGTWTLRVRHRRPGGQGDR